jgi:hypothetical protein
MRAKREPRAEGFGGFEREKMRKERELWPTSHEPQKSSTKPRVTSHGVEGSLGAGGALCEYEREECYAVCHHVQLCNACAGEARDRRERKGGRQSDQRLGRENTTRAIPTRTRRVLQDGSQRGRGEWHNVGGGEL